MSDVIDGKGDVNWKTVMDLLNKEQVVEIPCQNERDFVRRATQVIKRAEKQNLGVEVARHEHGLRVEPRADAVSGGFGADASSGREAREERQRERAQRREALRAERGADRDRER